MRIEDYLELYGSYVKTLVATNPTDFTEVSLKEVLIDAVNQLKPHRLNDHMTRQTVTNILRKYQRALRTADGEINHYDEFSVDSVLLSHILLKYFKREVSFHYAYVLLQQIDNGRIAIAENLIYRSEQEIEDAVLADRKSAKHGTKEKETTFTDLLISDHKDALLNLLHSLLDTTNNNKDFAILVLALEELGLLGKYGTKKNLYETLQSEFGNIGTDANFNHYLNPNNKKMILDSEIESFTTPIKNLLSRKS